MDDAGSRCQHGTPMCGKCRAAFDYNPPSAESPDRLVHDEMVRVMRDLAQRVNGLMPPGVCFAMFLFQTGPGGWCTYLSSAQRADVVQALKEFIEREEGKEPRVRIAGA